MGKIAEGTLFFSFFSPEKFNDKEHNNREETSDTYIMALCNMEAFIWIQVQVGFVKIYETLLEE